MENIKQGVAYFHNFCHFQVIRPIINVATHGNDRRNLF